MLPFLQGKVQRERRRVFQPTTSSLKLLYLLFGVLPGKKNLFTECEVFYVSSLFCNKYKKKWIVGMSTIVEQTPAPK